MYDAKDIDFETFQKFQRILNKSKELIRVKSQKVSVQGDEI